MVMDLATAVVNLREGWPSMNQRCTSSGNAQRAATTTTTTTGF